LLLLAAFVLYTCFKPDPFGNIEKLLKKDDLNQAYQEWKALKPTAQASSQGREILATLRKRFISTAAARARMRQHSRKRLPAHKTLMRQRPRSASRPLKPTRPRWTR
jgi:hypothetical protein